MIDYDILTEEEQKKITRECLAVLIDKVRYRGDMRAIKYLMKQINGWCTETVAPTDKEQQEQIKTQNVLLQELLKLAEK